MKSIARFFVTVICVMITAYILPGIEVGDVWAAILVAAILGLLNMFVKPILVLFTIPITFFTLGLFLLVINGFTVWLTAKLLPENYFDVKSIWWAILFSVVLSVVNSITENILGLKDKKEED